MTTRKREWLEALRKRRGLSQARLAEHLGIDPKTPARWERGTQNMYLRHRPALAEALGITLDELDELETAYQKSQQGEVSATPTVVGSELVPAATAQPWELMDVLTRSSIDLRVVSQMETALGHCAEAYPAQPPDALRPTIHRQLSRIRDALDVPQPVEVRRHLVRLLGYACGLAANTAIDSHDSRLGDAFFQVAAHASQEAEDLDLAAWIAACRAIAADASRDFGAARRLLEDAGGYARTNSRPRRRAWIFALRARVLAARGERSEALTLLDESQATLSDTQDPVAGPDFFDEPRLEGIRGSALLWLGEFDTAESVLAAAIARRPESELKGRALLTLDLARCRLLQNEHDEAVRLTAASLELASGSLVQPIVSKTVDVVNTIRSAQRREFTHPMFEQLEQIEAKVLEGLSQ